MKEDEPTLSPREQYEQQKAAMEALMNSTATTAAATEAPAETPADAPAAAVTTVSFTAGGFTVYLDSTFKADYDKTEGLTSYIHKNGESSSYTMKVSITRSSNYAGYKTSEEIARYIASQRPDERTVGSANGVYYVLQGGNNPVVKAYYVDDSGYYWIVDGYTKSGLNFDDYVNQLIQFCTTGNIA